MAGDLMTSFKVIVPFGVAAVALLLVSACDKAKERDVAAPAAAPAPIAAEPLPGQPAWFAGVAGKTLVEAFSAAEGSCVGNTDNVEVRYAGGVKIVGWGWDPKAKAPVSRVVVVDGSGKIVGGGESGLGRPDVIAARPGEVTSPTTGWSAIVPLAKGPVDAFGVVADGKATCRLGHLEI
jgi:hypothetical protein